MKNPEHNFADEEIILNSLGLLYDKEKIIFEKGIHSAAEFQKKDINEFNNLASLLSLAVFSNKVIKPSTSVKDRLFRKLNLVKIPGEKTNNFDFIFTDSIEWTPHPDVDGIQIKPLSHNKDKGYFMLLMKAAAGCHYPAHHHSGAEECYVLEGDLIVEGKILGPGDFHHAESDSDHNPLTTKNGCTLLLVIDPEDL